MVENILRFFSELKLHNDREWFTDHKNEYEVAKKDFEKIGTELIRAIAQFDDDIKHVELKDCVFRIYRDIRFSNDKTPYKTHFGAFIASAGGRKSQRGGYYLHLDPQESFLSVGVWCPQPNVLKALRQSIYDNIDEFNEIRNQPDFKRTYADSFYEEDKLKTIPAGFPKDFPDADLLKLKHYMVSYVLDEKILKSKNMVSEVAQLAKTAKPFLQFLNYTVDEVMG